MKTTRPLKVATLLQTLLTALTACQSAVSRVRRNATYGAYELIGVEKRDLLKKRIGTAREEQDDAKETFSDALDRLKAVYNFDGGKLESEYEAIRDSHKRAVDQAEDVRQSIERMNEVADDLFAEWETEIDEIKTRTLRDQSRKTLRSTRQRYDELKIALERSERQMTPVLDRLNDQVLYLKHNLNAQAIASLKTEAQGIQGEIESLINDVNKSIAAADAFIQQLR